MSGNAPAVLRMTSPRWCQRQMGFGMELAEGRRLAIKTFDAVACGGSKRRVCVAPTLRRRLQWAHLSLPFSAECA